jgi:cytochrome c oxidase assembly protein subunit 11
MAAALLHCWAGRTAYRCRPSLTFVRTQFNFAKKPSPQRPPPRTSAEKSQTTMLYLLSLGVATVGAAYAAVPLYRIFCQSSGYGGTVKEGHDASGEKVAALRRNEDRLIRVHFTADTAATMQWNFRPQQPVIFVHPGETALAFYTARNPTDKPIDGISTYNVVPFEAGQYFNKIQCFCFEEQRLNPQEEVDMPVFFYIDPDFCDDPFLEKIDTITLSYTFFEAKPGFKMPFPSWNKSNQ